MKTSKLAWINIILSLLVLSFFTTIHAKEKNDFGHSTKSNILFSNYFSKATINAFKSIEKKTAVTQLKALQSHAKLCVEKTNDQLTDLNNVLKNLHSLDKQTNINEMEDFKYFATKKTNYIKQIIACQKVILQSEETISELNYDIQKTNAYINLYRSTPIWTILSKAPRIFTEFDNQEFYRTSGLASFTIKSSAFLFITIFIFLLLGIFIRKKSIGWLKQKKERNKHLKELIIIAKKHIIPLLMSGSAYAFISIMCSPIDPKFLIAGKAFHPSKPLIEEISLLLFFYLITIAALDYSCLAIKRSKEHISLERLQTFFYSSKILAAFIAAATASTMIFKNQGINIQLQYTITSYFFFLLAIAIAWKNWPIFSSFISKITHKKISIYFKYLTTLTLSGAFIVQALGYYQLSLHIIYGIVSIPLTLMIFYLLGKALSNIEKFLHGEKGERSKAIKEHLELKRNKKISEFALIKISAYLLTTYLLILALLNVFGMPAPYFDKINKIFMNGFTLVNIKVVPFQIILAMTLFAIIFIFGRWIINVVTKKRSTRNEKEIQDVMASLLTYINFCVALIISLIIAGIDFTGLAFIAGGLSVGIGLGLQNIANNFISGIILLIEKPFKPGDRVNVNDKEGFVKEIRLRSTQITTTAKEDIIVPNSDFIAGQVINYTFKDGLTRVACRVGASYDSDIDLVKETLLEIAKKNPDVRDDEANKPAVLFNEFADSTLNFALYCTIDDANKRYRVISDLNSMVFKEFKKLSIEIAYPQLDVHMKK